MSLQNRVDKISASYWAKYQKIFGIDNPVPPVMVSGRMTRTLGICYYEPTKISLSKTYLENHYDIMVNQVLPHELAHALCYILYPEALTTKPARHHGKEWQSIMYAIGQNPTTTIDIK